MTKNQAALTLEMINKAVECAMDKGLADDAILVITVNQLRNFYDVPKSVPNITLTGQMDEIIEQLNELIGVYNGK